MNYQKRTLLLIAIATLLRLIYSSATELGADEAYYWTYALKLQWNYFDHPPLVAWLIRLTTFNLSFHNEIFVRLGAVISAAICTWLIFKLGTLLHNLQTGWFAALIYTASIYCSITAGANILPDSPQLIFWLAGIFFFIKISRLEDNMPKAALLWCLFGLMSGLCIMCKAHGVLLWFGALLYVCFTNRHWFKYRGIYLSAVITLVIISPLVIWNIQNNFITYKFHTSRISMNGSGIQLIGFVKFIAQQIFINNPFNFFLICTSIFAAFKEKIPIKKKEIMILLLFSLPLIFLVLIISLFREAFPHWPAPGYTCLFILPAANLASRAKSSPSSVPNVLKWALGYMVIIGILQIILINYFPGTLSTVKQGIKTGNQDVTLCMYGWEEAGYKIDSLYKSDVTKVSIL